jgi:hypothetical protein
VICEGVEGFLAVILWNWFSMALLCTLVFVIKIRGLRAKRYRNIIFPVPGPARDTVWGGGHGALYTYSLLRYYLYYILFSFLCTFMYLNKKESKKKGLGWYRMGYIMGT